VATRQFDADRVRFFSDGVFAVLITILVLELKPPHADTFRDLLPLRPTGLSYAVSYLFIAIVWLNHHHLFGYAAVALVQLCASVLGVADPVRHRVDRREQAGRRPPSRSIRPSSSSSTSPTSPSAGRRSIGPRTRTFRSGCADCCE
jgi:hypothetical protein